MWTNDMGIRALSLDGGGVKALSQLIMLRDVMLRLNKDDKNTIPLVRDVFEIIGGTGSGAVLAVLLGRFGLTVEEAIKEFMDFSIAVFAEDDNEQTIDHRTSRLEDAIKAMLARHGLPPDARLNGADNADNRCKVFICAVSTANLHHPQLFRTYHSRVSYMDCTIIEAISASMAFPSVFSPVSIGPPGLEQSFVGGGYTCNNPTRELMKEAISIYGEQQRVACLFNLGAGRSRVLALNDDVEGSDNITLLEEIASDGDIMAEGLSNQLSEIGIYLRLSVDRGLDTVGWDHWMEFGNIEVHTRAYLQGTEVNRIIENCVGILENPAGSATLLQLTQSAHSESRFAGLPPLTPYFVMRSHIWEAMMRALIDIPFEEPEEKQRIVVLSGMGGCGKTQMAIKFAKEHLSHFPYVIFCDASSEATLQGDLQAAIRSKGYPLHTAEDALSILAEDEDFEDWLIIYDNANGVNVDLRRFLPHCHHGSIIITTRNRDLAQLSTAADEHIGPMTDAEAIELVLRAARRPISIMDNEDSNIALNIAHELGNLPLALVRAGSYAHRKRCFKNYLKVYHQNRVHFLKEVSLSEVDLYHHSVYATIETSYNALPQAAKELLHVLSFFHHSNIPRELFAIAAESDFLLEENKLDLPRLYSTKEIAQELRSILYSDDEWNELQLLDTIHALQLFSLVWVTYSPRGSSLDLHSLISSWARDHLQDKDRVRYKAMATRIVTCCAAKAQTKLQNDLVPHILKLVKDGELHPNDNITFATLLANEGKYEEVINLRRQVVAACQVWNGLTHLSTIDATASLADALYMHGIWDEAAELQTQVLAVRKSMLGDTHPESLEAAVALSRSLDQLGRREEAETIRRQVQKSRRDFVESTMAPTVSIAPVHPRSIVPRGAEAKAVAIKMIKGFQSEHKKRGTAMA